MWIILRGSRQFWIFLALAGIVVGAVMFLYVFGVSFIARDWTLLAEARADLVRAEAIRRNLNGAEQKRAALEPEIGVIQASFADPKNPLPFIEAVEFLGRRLGVKAELTLTSSGSADQADAYLVAVSGSFPKVAMFLNLFEVFPFLVTMGDAEITRIGAITEAGVLASDQVRFSVAVRILAPR